MITIHECIHLLVDGIRLILQIFYHICESMYYNLFGIQEKSVTGDVVLITGAGHGIGKELAIQYAHLGAIVVCLDVNQQTNENTANEIKKTVKTLKENMVYAYQCDVSNREEVFKVTEVVKREVGDVTILINNAGIMPCHVFLDHTADQILRIFNINILAHFWMLQAFLPNMIEKNYGHIVAISSIAGLAGFPNITPYCATKYAVAGTMEALKAELREHSQGKSIIKFTTVYPYMVNTGLCKKPKVNERLSKLTSLASPKEVAAKIISAQRRNIKEISVPSFWTYAVSIIKLLPEDGINCVRDFLNSGLEPED